MRTKYYLAYGSNINLPQMEVRCPDAIVAGTAILNDYELVFRGNNYRAVANIEKKIGAYVPVVLWSISSSDEKALDRYEGWPTLYVKKILKVKMRGEIISATAYVMNKGRCFGAPSSHYLETIADGYDSFGFDMRPLYDAAERDEARAGCKDANKIKRYRLYLEKEVFSGDVESYLKKLQDQGLEVKGFDEYI